MTSFSLLPWLQNWDSDILLLTTVVPELETLQPSPCYRGSSNGIVLFFSVLPWFQFLYGKLPPSCVAVSTAFSEATPFSAFQEYMRMRTHRKQQRTRIYYSRTEQIIIEMFQILREILQTPRKFCSWIHRVHQRFFAFRNILGHDQMVENWKISLKLFTSP